MIELHTQLNDGIYKSQGGGQDLIHRHWTTGPRNLVIAILALEPHAREMIQSYGNVGAGRSWLSVDGVMLDSADCADVLYANEARRDYDREGPLVSDRPGSRTDGARAILQRVAQSCKHIR